MNPSRKLPRSPSDLTTATHIIQHVCTKKGNSRRAPDFPHSTTTTHKHKGRKIGTIWQTGNRLCVCRVEEWGRGGSPKAFWVLCSPLAVIGPEEKVKLGNINVFITPLYIKPFFSIRENAVVWRLCDDGRRKIPSSSSSGIFHTLLCPLFLSKLFNGPSPCLLLWREGGEGVIRRFGFVAGAEEKGPDTFLSHFFLAGKIIFFCSTSSPSLPPTQDAAAAAPDSYCATKKMAMDSRRRRRRRREKQSHFLGFPLFPS